MLHVYVFIVSLLQKGCLGPWRWSVMIRTMNAGKQLVKDLIKVIMDMRLHAPLLYLY